MADWRDAPLSPKLRATLAFLEKLTLDPASITAEDAHVVLAAGVSREALEGAVYVCSVFNLMSRVADALGLEPPSDVQRDKTAALLMRAGYLGP